MDWLVWLILLLGLVTLVGHGIWVLLAKLFGGGKKPPPPIAPTDEALAAQGQLNKLLALGLIDEPTYQRATEGLRTLRQRQAAPVPVLPFGQSPAPVAAPPPVSMPSAPVSVPALPARRPLPPRPPPAPRKPRRPMSLVLAGFMEEKNIRWGELLGGLLIVGCSIALVVSFWAEIAQRPFFKFGVFTGVTAGLFSLGLYTEHRWRLPTTSRGLLLIGTLLVPLNCVAFVALSHGQADKLTAITELAALAVFAALTRAATWIILPAWHVLLAAGVILISASIVAVQFCGAAPLSTAGILSMAAVPLLVYGACTGIMLGAARRWKSVHAHAAEGMFILLGVLFFATSLDLGLIVHRSGNWLWALHRLSAPISLAGVPAMAAGLLLWRRVSSPKLVSTRIAGTAVAIVGALVLVSGIAMAWPDPGAMLPVAAADFVAISVVAFLFEIPAAHLLAIPCLVLAYLLAFHVVFHHVGWTSRPLSLARVLAGATGGEALVPLFALLIVAAETLRRFRVQDGRMYAWLSCGVAALSLGLVSWSGFAAPGDPFHATWVYAAYSAAGFVVARRWRRESASWIAWVLLLASFVQFFTTRSTTWMGWANGLVAFAAVAATVAVVGRLWPHWVRLFDSRPARFLAGIANAVAIGLLVGNASLDAAGEIGLRAALSAAFWFALALAAESAAVFMVAQFTVATALAFCVIARLATRPWFGTYGLLDPWSLQTLAIGIASLALLWSLVRLALPDRARIKQWLEPPWSFETVAGAVLSVLLAVLVAFAVAPGLISELSRVTAARIPANIRQLHAAGAGSWVLLGILLGTLITRVVRGGQCPPYRGASKIPFDVVLTALILLAWLACPLWAARWTGASANASALRWASAVFFAGGSVTLWIGRWSESALARRNRVTLAVVAALPVLVLTLYPAAATLVGEHLRGPAAESFFGAMSRSISYSVPLLVITLVFVVNAIRERSPAWAFAASLVANLTITLGYALSVVNSGRDFGPNEFVRLAQLNTIGFAGFAAAWLGAIAIRQKTLRPNLRPPYALRVLMALAVAGNVLLLFPSAIILFADPRWDAAPFSTTAGWAALLLTIAAAALAGSLRPPRLTMTRLSAILMGLTAIGSLTAAQWGGGSWTGYHALLAGTVACEWAVLGIGVVVRKRGLVAVLPLGPSPDPPIDVTSGPAIPLQYERRDDSHRAAPPPVFLGGTPIESAVLRWLAAFGLVTVLLALRAMPGDPDRPWWSVSAVVLTSMVLASAAAWAGVPRLIYASGLLLNVSATLWWIVHPWPLTSPTLTDLVAGNVVVLSLSGIAAMVMHLNVFSRQGVRRVRLPFHVFAADGSVLVTALLVFLAVASNAGGYAITPHVWLLWAAVIAAAAATAALFRDSLAHDAAPALYALGLIGSALLLPTLRLRDPQQEWAAAMALAIFNIFNSLLWRTRRRLADLARTLGMAPHATSANRRLLPPASNLVAAAVTALAFWCDFAFRSVMPRASASAAAVLQLVAIVLCVQDEDRIAIRRAALLTTVAATVALAWAFMAPDRENVMERVVVLALVFEASTAGAALAGAAHADRGWLFAARTLIIPLAGAFVASLLLTLGLELAFQFSSAHVRMHPAAIAAVIVMLLSGGAAAIALAIRPESRPPPLSPRKRAALVYGAELFLALTFVHVRLTMPWLFTGFFAQYWPLVIMVVAFAGVGVSELLRTRQPILAGPLLRTGAFLPLLPVLTFWLVRSRVPYSNLLFLTGIFYAMLAVVRRSFLFAVLAALAANGGLWSLLAGVPGLHFLQHPQLWLIPVALSVLGAGELNRDRLGTDRLRLLRYLCLMVVYVSSTADVFLNGVARAPWLPLVLAALSVIGVLLGILLRLRAFLLLGSTFLALAVVTMIYYASADLGWTWVWYVAGIVLGLCIIVLFALFEKQRTRMVAVVEGLKQWQ